MKTAKSVFTLTSVLAMALSLTACQQQSNSATPPTGPSAKGTPGSEPGKSSDSPSVALTVPEDLKNDAYRYIGFDKTTPVKYLFSRVQGSKAEEGTQVCEVKSVDKDTVTIQVKRSGALEDLGTEEFLVKKDGIYLVSTLKGKPDAPVMQMPAKLEVGTVWDYNFPLSGEGGSKMTLSGKARVEAQEKVKVVAGEFDTIRVSETANLDNNGAKATVSMKTWYAKDIGVVKMKMEMKNQSNNIVTSTMELSSTGQ